MPNIVWQYMVSYAGSDESKLNALLQLEKN